MSDQFGPGGDDEGPGAMPPPPPPPPMTPVEAPLTLDTESEVSSRSGIGGRVAAGIAGIVLLVAGTAFAVTQLGSSGPSTAEDSWHSGTASSAIRWEARWTWPSPTS